MDVVAASQGILIEGFRVIWLTLELAWLIAKSIAPYALAFTIFLLIIAIIGVCLDD